MSKKEQTPIVIDLRQHNSGYGTTYGNSSSSPSKSGNNNNPMPQTPSTIYTLVGQRRVEVRDHCHRQRSEGVDIKARRKLIIASVLCLLFMICEIIGGILSNSLAIATDAAHLLTDFASFMISLFAIWIAGRPSTQRMSFGWYRAEVIGALASVVMIWFITAILVWLAIERIINRDFEVDAKIMLITSGLAILVNLIMGVQLQHGHTHGGGIGHSHGSSKPKKSITNIPKPTSLTSTDSKTADSKQYNNLSFEDIADEKATNNKKNSSAEALPTNGTTTTTTQPLSNNDCTDRSNAGDGNGNGEGDGDADDATFPAAGLQTFSYQNTRSISEVHAEIAAVMAETAPGGHHHHGGKAHKEAVNLNVRAAFIHVVGDMVQSIGVFLAALLIYFKPEWAIADPICTFIFSIIVLLTTFAIMKDALLVLMEGTPSYMHYAEVLNIFQQIEGVERVHNLRIWALSINKIALSVHLAIGPGANPKKILQEATSAVHLRYNFFETTIQIEDFTPDMENCQQCSVPEK